jgi:hypothetical protein
MDWLAIARNAGLEVLEAWTQTADLLNYDADSNQWHESIVVARKPAAATAFAALLTDGLSVVFVLPSKILTAGPRFFIRTVKSIAKSNQLFIPRLPSLAENLDRSSSKGRRA